MAMPIYGDDDVADKTPTSNIVEHAHVALPHQVHPQIGIADLVTPDQLVAVLAVIDELGCATLGECVTAILPHDRPAAALIQLAELGLIGFDADRPFDQHVLVWRT